MELVASPQSFPTFLAAAAQVLSTYDIFERIVCLDVLDRQDMINCAVVCRSWSDLALNGLWSHSSFDDLLHIFPSIAKTHKQDGELEWSIGNISIAHWDRFLHYSKRVNTLEATCSDRLNHSRLTNLHLQINASTWPDETVDALLSSAETYELDSLDVLSLSASPMSSVDDTALYLNHMIPSSAKLITDALDEECLPLGSTPEGNENHAEDVKEMEDRKAKWSEVCKRVKGFRRVQAVLAKHRAQSRADMRLPN
ncbi:hypothetical protein A7U60_g501 [Sanghuangporus baumii]|uniref:F-box domain-containing protein n=1 Tax=Sanghuangporus baumii TaxID=108892 RepID=A0A9Q5NCC3_SANBA|nr:hypothetical protein A7U60_g501 [Sanghuangporus baumii]